MVDLDKLREHIKVYEHFCMARSFWCDYRGALLTNFLMVIRADVYPTYLGDDFLTNVLPRFLHPLQL